MLTTDTAPDIAPRMLSTADAAQYVGIAASTLEKFRHYGRPDGPPYVTIGRRVLYSRAALDAYLASRTVDPTAHAFAPAGT